MQTSSNRGIDQLFLCLSFCFILIFLPPAFSAGDDPAPPRHGWPLAVEHPYPDGEDEDPSIRYFGFHGITFFFKENKSSAAKADQQLTERLSVILEALEEPVHFDAAEGEVWDFGTVWSTSARNLVLWKRVNSSGVTIQGLRLYPSLELVRSEALEKATIENGRLYFSTPPDETMTVFFPPSTAVPEGKRSWRDIIRPYHDLSGLPMAPLSQASQIINAIPDGASDPEATRLGKQLLHSPVVDIDPENLLGDWRVRSLQVSTEAAYLYPFFKARFKKQPEGIFFEKTSGSQRCSGWIFPDLPTQYYFLGGATVNEDPQVPYSGLDPVQPRSGIPPETDTAGILYQLGPNRLLLLRDLVYDTSFELYELVR